MFDVSLSKVFVILGLLAVLLELFVGIQAGFDLVVIGTVMIASGLIGDFFNQFSLTLIVAIILSGAYLVFFRKIIKKKITPTTHHLNTDRLQESEGTVTKAISADKPGQVTIDDETWRAVSQSSFKAGDKIVVESVRGVTVHVRKKIT